MEQLYFQRKTNQYYLVVDKKDHIFCYKCRKLIGFDDSVIIQRSFSKKSYSKHYYCSVCIKHHTKRQYDEFKATKISPEVPSYSIIVPEYAPSLSSCRNESVFSMATKQDGADVVDRTVLAGKESWDGAQIGSESAARLKELDKPFKQTKNGGLAYLRRLSESSPAIDHKRRKRLK